MTLTPLCRSYVSERERGKKGIRRYVIAQDMSVRSKFMFFFVTRLSLTLRCDDGAMRSLSFLSLPPPFAEEEKFVRFGECFNSTEKRRTAATHERKGSSSLL